jgi:hypothetical protein
LLYWYKSTNTDAAGLLLLLQECQRAPRDTVLQAQTCEEHFLNLRQSGSSPGIASSWMSGGSCDAAGLSSPLHRAADLSTPLHRRPAASAASVREGMLKQVVDRAYYRASVSPRAYYTSNNNYSSLLTPRQSGEASAPANPSPQSSETEAKGANKARQTKQR